MTPAEQVEREVRPDGMVSFDRNWYCASPELVGKVVTVKGTATKVRVFHRGEELAVHERHYTQGERSTTAVMRDTSMFLRLVQGL
ncbi:MAG: Mu transposase domain-containing protein [Ignavibacteriales bacterium]